MFISGLGSAEENISIKGSFSITFRMNGLFLSHLESGIKENNADSETSSIFQAHAEMMQNVYTLLKYTYMKCLNCAINF